VCVSEKSERSEKREREGGYTRVHGFGCTEVPAASHEIMITGTQDSTVLGTLTLSLYKPVITTQQLAAWTTTLSCQGLLPGDALCLVGYQPGSLACFNHKVATQSIQS